MTAKKQKTEEVHSAAVVVVQKKVGTIMNGANGVLTDFKKEDVEKRLKELVKKHKKRISEIAAIDVLNKEQFEEAKKINAELRSARYTLQNIEKGNTSVLAQMRKVHGIIIGELIDIVSPSEQEILTVIKREEDRKAFEKQKEERLAAERKERIEGKIADAGTEFTKLIAEAKKTKNWDLFDAYYSTFEGQLEDLEEMAFEGQEVLDDAAAKKEEAIAAIAEEERLAKQAEEQAEKDREQNERQRLLNEQEAKRVEDKRRTKEMFGIGFMFNGEDFVKDESSYTEAAILDAEPEAFENIVTLWKDQIQAEKDEAERVGREAEEARQAQTERTALYNKLVEEAGGLELDVKEFIVQDPSLVSESQVEDLKGRINHYKTEQGRLAEERRQEEQLKAEQELKAAGKVVYDAVLLNVQEMYNNIAPESIQNEDAKEAALRFIEEVKIAVDNLKINTRQ